MTPSISAPTFSIPLEPLTFSSFHPFGTVIENPSHAPSNNKEQSTTSPPRPKVISANQGSALKHLDVTHLHDFYAGCAPSGKPAKPVFNMFVCKPRILRSRRIEASSSGQANGGVTTDQVTSGNSMIQKIFDVRILERHPFTSQTFVPMGIPGANSPTAPRTRYLVIVAPTLEGSTYPSSSNIQPLASSDTSIPLPQGPGLPDLSRIRAFLADGAQAVTYGPGTWHAPMVVIGEQAIDFVVVQYANGVGEEDCQEVLLESRPGAKNGGDDEGISVVMELVPDGYPQDTRTRARL